MTPVPVRPCLRELRWSFDDGPVFPGFTNNTTWNGFLNVAVDTDTWPYVLLDLLAGAAGDPETISSYQAMAPTNGLVSLGHGFATHEVPATWSKAFPDYPLSTMPPIPAGWSDMSWRHDAAPSFGPCVGPMGEAAQLWIDYADPALRETLDMARYTFCRRDGRDEPEIVYAGDDYDVAMDHAAREVLACSFANRLVLLLPPEDWKEMRLRNRHSTGSVCASHDFLDANMVMLAAWEAERGKRQLRPEEPTHFEQDFAHINAAWHIATTHYLTASEDGARFDNWRLSGRHVESLVAAGQDLGSDDDYDAPGRVYSPGHMEAFQPGWLINVGNSSTTFVDLHKAETHLWQAYAAVETRQCGGEVR